jgi:curved DNA-binding protein CbpA
MRHKCLNALGLSSANATDADIKKAYKRMSLLYHPDRNSLPSALEKMKAINNAFEHLTGKNND